MAQFGPPVTNQSLIDELERRAAASSSSAPQYGAPVTDPALIKQLESMSQNQNPTDQVEDPGAYLDNLPGDEGFFRKLPRNIAIGLANLGHSTLNLPHDLAQTAQNRLQELSKNMDASLPASVKNSPAFKANVDVASLIPKQDDYDFASLLGQKNAPTLMDSLIQGGIHYLPEILGGRALLTAGVRRLIGTHELDAVKDAIEKFGTKDFSYSPNVTNEARKYLPNTEATRQLFERSQGGDYSSSFAMRSQLGRHQNNLANSPLAAERLLAPEVSDLRQTMLNELKDELGRQGLHAEAEMLPNGIKKYSQYMQVKNAVMPILKKWGIPFGFGALTGTGGLYAYKKAKQYGS